MGDVSANNSQLMAELLDADARVVLVAQLRDDGDFAKSVMALHRSPVRAETYILRSRGLTKTNFPKREDRLKRYMQLIRKEAQTLQKMYGPERVVIIELHTLNKLGQMLLQKLGSDLKWDPNLGRNNAEARTHRRLAQRRK